MNTENFDLSGYLKERRTLLEESLNRIILQFDQQRELVQAMRHSLMAGGKRLRPVLGMAAAEAAGGDFRYTLPAACAIEMVHTYSLIHDDLPAMDNDDLRRGVPTCHRAFSEATAILAGDALLTHAFTILSKPGKIISEPGGKPLFELYPDKRVLLELVALISDAAGVNGMVEGQMMDMLAEGGVSSSTSSATSNLNCPSDQMECLRKLHHLKTGRMIVASVQAGALSVGADSATVTLLSTYAEKIGLAFQVVDDILNVEGDASVMGKAAGSDHLNAKLTFPALLGLDESKKFAARLIEDAIEPLFSAVFEKRTLPLISIAQYILKRDR